MNLLLDLVRLALRRLRSSILRWLYGALCSKRSSTMSAAIDEHLVPGTSNTYYIPEFVTEEEEDFLIRKVHQT